MVLYRTLKSALGGKLGKDAASMLFTRRPCLLAIMPSNQQTLKDRGWQEFLSAARARTVSR